MNQTLPAKFARVSFVVSIGLLSLTLAACGGGSSGGSASLAARAPATASAATPVSNAPAAANTVTLSQFTFAPVKLQAKAGSSVTFTNKDDILHTVTAGTPDKPTGEFDGQLPQPGATFVQRFEKPGTFAFFCNRHQFMRGEIDVTS
jgi:plastocyanin